MEFIFWRSLMIVSENTEPELIEFQRLMKKTDDLLNKDAKNHESYYQKKKGQLLILPIWQLQKKDLSFLKKSMP